MTKIQGDVSFYSTDQDLQRKVYAKPEIKAMTLDRVVQGGSGPSYDGKTTRKP